MANPRRGLKSAVNRDRLSGRDLAPGRCGPQSSGGSKRLRFREHPIGARQNAEKPPAARKKQAEITKKKTGFATWVHHRTGKSGTIY